MFRLHRAKEEEVMGNDANFAIAIISRWFHLPLKIARLKRRVGYDPTIAVIILSKKTLAQAPLIY